MDMDNTDGARIFFIGNHKERRNGKVLHLLERVSRQSILCYEFRIAQSLYQRPFYRKELLSCFSMALRKSPSVIEPRSSSFLLKTPAIPSLFEVISIRASFMEASP